MSNHVLSICILMLLSRSDFQRQILADEKASHAPGATELEPLVPLPVPVAAGFTRMRAMMSGAFLVPGES